MSDATIQSFLDPDATGNGAIIVRRQGGDDDTLTNYYVVGVGHPYAGRSMWVQVTNAGTDSEKANTIIAALTTP